MELVNHTRYPAGIARMVYGEDRIAASVLVRVTYGRDGKSFVPDGQQPWIVSMTPWEGPKGWMDGDLIFYKGGVDVFLFGHAVPAGGRPTTEMEVAIWIDGGFERKVRVIGPRVWYRGFGGLSATMPQRFAALPLSLAHAFGGTDVYDGLAVAWPENPDGQGFYVTEENAIDRPLPRIEEIDHPVVKWDDRPPPAGLVPLPVGSPLRTRQLKLEGDRTKLTPKYFNAAFQRMIANEIKPGATAVISGVSAKGPITIVLPVHRFFIRLRFGDERHDLPLAIDQVAFLTDEDRLMIAYRCPFRYVVRELEERSCELFEGNAAIARGEP